jgi:methylglutaconyl-CoA hydratase
VSFNLVKIDGTAAARRLTLARPEIRNAFNAELIAEITRALQELAAETEIRTLIVAAEGQTFCAGADFHWMGGLKDAGLEANLEDSRRLFDMFHALYAFPCPTIVRVQGGAFGGGAGLVACGDFVVMADDAVLSFSEVRIGLVPATISPFVIRKIGEGRAREVFLTGMQVTAPRALEIGLANRVVEVAALDEAVSEYTEQFGRCGSQALRVTKELLHAVPGMPLDLAKEFTARRIATQRMSEEGQEGMAAFLEKRKPTWVTHV